MEIVKIEDGKLIFKDRVNPENCRHIEMYFENSTFKIVEVKTNKEETVLTDINFN